VLGVRAAVTGVVPVDADGGRIELGRESEPPHATRVSTSPIAAAQGARLANRLAFRVIPDNVARPAAYGVHANVVSGLTMMRLRADHDAFAG